MVKKGPCCHCGVTSTPLWRNGPPDKPVLCNACGSRWRTKGSLTNYAPLHVRAETDNFLDYKELKIKIKACSRKRKSAHENIANGSISSNFDDNLWMGMDVNTCNTWSSGSAVSNHESCPLFDTTYVNEKTGPTQSSMVADRLKPAKKTSTHRKSSSIATLSEDLCTILHQQQSSGFSASSEEDLIFESNKSIFSEEIGHGSYLITSTKGKPSHLDPSRRMFF